MRRAIRLLAWVLSLGGFGLFFSVTLPLAFGWETLVVASSSMAPSVPRGALVVVRPVNPDQIAAGDVITFWSGGLLTTHRVVAAEGGAFVTKGDGNSQPDPRPVSAAQVRGRILYQLPLVGYGFWHLGAAMSVMLVLPALLLAAGGLVRALGREA